MRQSKTLKICANHLVYPGMNVQEHCGSGKSCVWHASDFADDELKDELFCIRFASVGDCKTFRSKVQEVAETQDKKEEREEVPDTAELLEKLSVEDRKTEVSKQEDVASEAKEGKQVADE